MEAREEVQKRGIGGEKESAGPGQFRAKAARETGGGSGRHNIALYTQGNSFTNKSERRPLTLKKKGSLVTKKNEKKVGRRTHKGFR